MRIRVVESWCHSATIWRLHTRSSGCCATSANLRAWGRLVDAGFSVFAHAQAIQRQSGMRYLLSYLSGSGRGAAARGVLDSSGPTMSGARQKHCLGTRMWVCRQRFVTMRRRMAALGECVYRVLHSTTLISSRVRQTDSFTRLIRRSTCAGSRTRQTTASTLSPPLPRSWTTLQAAGRS